MEENITKGMTDRERKEFEEFRAYKQAKEKEEKAKAMRDDYHKMVDDEIEAAIPQLQEISEDIKERKAQIFDNFKTVLELKGEMFQAKHGEVMNYNSHTFTNTDGTKRITLGQNMLDNYLDTAEDGVKMISEYIQSLATDAKSHALVGMILKLLAKDAKGTLKAQRILQLRKIAEESGDAQFIEGVKIIEEAYRPIPSKTFIKAEVKDEKTGAWKHIPLSMTDN